MHCCTNKNWPASISMYLIEWYIQHNFYHNSYGYFKPMHHNISFISETPWREGYPWGPHTKYWRQKWKCSGRQFYALMAAPGTVWRRQFLHARFANLPYTGNAHHSEFLYTLPVLSDSRCATSNAPYQVEIRKKWNRVYAFVSTVVSNKWNFMWCNSFKMAWLAPVLYLSVAVKKKEQRWWMCKITCSGVVEGALN